jgi:hypothetical protein
MFMDRVKHEKIHVLERHEAVVAKQEEKVHMRDRLETAFEVYVLLRKIAEFHEDTKHYLDKIKHADHSHSDEHRAIEYFHTNTASIEINQNGVLQHVVFRGSLFPHF